MLQGAGLVELPGVVAWRREKQIFLVFGRKYAILFKVYSCFGGAFVKRVLKTVLCVILVLIVLGAIVVGVPRFCFGYDIFERGGWSTTKDGKLRYLRAGGEPVLGWMTMDEVTYYLDPEQNGAVYTGWMNTEEGRFFLDKNGARVAGWTEINGDTYCFSDTGIMLTGWIETEHGWSYLDENGVLQTGWLNRPEGRCYLSETGAMVIGWLELSGERYYFNEDGMLQTGWLDQPEGRYYLSESGSMATGWIVLDGTRYYLNESGVMCSGWLELDGKRYFLTESGAAYTGWMEDGGDRLYFHDDGTMAIGRVEIDGVAHHFTSSGKYFVLVNPWNPVPEDYEWNLVDYEGFWVEADCLDALKAMIAACNAAGHSCKVNSAYRSYDRQVFLFERKVTKLMGQGYSRAAAEKETALSIAVPGTSEHQLGLAVDMKSGNGTYDWLAKHSWEYGFTLRYPYGKTEVTGIYYEPWHFRYVGNELAKELYDLGLCVEEYINLLTEQANS